MKQQILNTISDLCSNFLYYDREDDSLLSAEQLNEAVNLGEITVDEIAAEFRKNIERAFYDMAGENKSHSDAIGDRCCTFNGYSILGCAYVNKSCNSCEYNSDNQHKTCLKSLKCAHIDSDCVNCVDENNFKSIPF